MLRRMMLPLVLSLAMSAQQGKTRIEPPCMGALCAPGERSKGDVLRLLGVVREGAGAGGACIRSTADKSSFVLQEKGRGRKVSAVLLVGSAACPRSSLRVDSASRTLAAKGGVSLGTREADVRRILGQPSAVDALDETSWDLLLDDFFLGDVVKAPGGQTLTYSGTGSDGWTLFVGISRGTVSYMVLSLGEK